MDQEEKNRLEKLMHFETAARKKGFRAIAGIDEAGRGPLAGPVVAAACIIPAGFYIENVNDSKQLTPEVRRRIFKHLITSPEICYGVGIVDAEEIDRINILQATIQAMLIAVSQLSRKPDLLLVDGLHLEHPSVPCQKIIKGDTLSQSIAAASVIAKETRDEMMHGFDALWPVYGFKSHKGYGTRQHILALSQHGPCPLHRRTFEPVKSLISLEDK